MRTNALAIGMPGPFELIWLAIFAFIVFAFVFLVFRVLWRAGSPRQDSSDRPRDGR